LLAGRLAVAFALNALGGAVVFGELQNGFLAFVIGATIVAMVPMLPAPARTLGEVAGYAAFGALAVVNVVSSAQDFDALSFAAGVALFAATAGSAALAAPLLGVEPESAIAGAGVHAGDPPPVSSPRPHVSAHVGHGLRDLRHRGVRRLPRAQWRDDRHGVPALLPLRGDPQRRLAGARHAVPPRAAAVGGHLS